MHNIELAPSDCCVLTLQILIKPTMKSKSLIPPKIEIALRLIVAVILLQTLFFKFTAHPDSVALFSEVSQFLTADNSLEAGIRIGTGIIELIAASLLLLRPTFLYGAIIAFATMGGAIKTHVFIIGINFHDDGGTLFAMAVIAFLASFAIVFNHRDEIPIVGKWFIRMRKKFG